jgi:hypothetical protein
MNVMNTTTQMPDWVRELPAEQYHPQQTYYYLPMHKQLNRQLSAQALGGVSTKQLNCDARDMRLPGAMSPTGGLKEP